LDNALVGLTMDTCAEVGDEESCGPHAPNSSVRGTPMLHGTNAPHCYTFSPDDRADGLFVAMDLPGDMVTNPWEEEERSLSRITEEMESKCSELGEGHADFVEFVSAMDLHRRRQAFLDCVRWSGQPKGPRSTPLADVLQTTLDVERDDIMNIGLRTGSLEKVEEDEGRVLQEQGRWGAALHEAQRRGQARDETFSDELPPEKKPRQRTLSSFAVGMAFEVLAAALGCEAGCAPERLTRSTPSFQL